MAYRERIGGGAYRGGLEIVPVPRLAPEDPRSHVAAADRRVDSVAFQTDDGALGLVLSSRFSQCVVRRSRQWDRRHDRIVRHSLVGAYVPLCQIDPPTLL